MTLHNDPATRYWDREVVEQTYQSWMTHPRVRSYINESISGSPHLWPMDWLQSFLHGRTFRRALSIGCGSGALERDLIRRGLCARIDAFDGSVESIRIAVQEAEACGYAERIHYFVANFNEPKLPKGGYDGVFAHQSLHHVAKLEKLYGAILRAMTPDALFYLDEYVGPSRAEWNDSAFAASRACYAMVPEKQRLADPLPLPIQIEDPSEAIRSSEILRELRHGFDVPAKRDYGGNLLAPMFPYVDTQDDALIESLIAAEREMLRGSDESFYAIVVARPRRGFVAFLARLRYFALPKLKRIVREVRNIGSA